MSFGLVERHYSAVIEIEIDMLEMMVTLNTKGHLLPVSANRELLKALIACRLAAKKYFGN